MMLNFRVVMVSDGCAAITDEEHAASLIAFHLQFGDVLTVEECVAGLGGAAAAPRVAAE